MRARFLPPGSPIDCQSGLLYSNFIKLRKHLTNLFEIFPFLLRFLWVMWKPIQIYEINENL